MHGETVKFKKYLSYLYTINKWIFIQLFIHYSRLV